MELGIYKLNKESVEPTFATEESACFDLRSNFYSVESVKAYSPDNHKTDLLIGETLVNNIKFLEIPSGFRVLIPTGLIFIIETGYSLRLHPRSSFSLKQGLTLANAEGIIDSDYYHETFVALHNTSHQTVVVNHGDRICQGEIVKSNLIDSVKFVGVSVMPSQKTNRKGGFGSTGINSQKS